MKKLDFKLSGRPKKLVLSVSAVVLTAAIVAGIVFGLRGQGEPVGVYPFTMVGMTEFWGDNQESYGPVTTDRIQTVFLSDTQTVTEVLVAQGDTVKKGDVLMTYDTTLSELQLERKRLDVEKAKLQVKEAEEELRRIANLEPMGDVDISFPTVNTDPGRSIAEKGYEVHPDQKFDGSKAEAPLVVWVREDRPLDNGLLKYLYATAVDFQIKNAKGSDSSASAMPDEGSGDNSQQSGGDNSQQSGGDNSQQPGGDNSQQPGGDNSQQPGGDNSQQPGGDNSQQPGGDNSQQPGGDNSQQPGGDNSQQPGGDNSQQPDDDNNQQPDDGNHQDPYQVEVDRFKESAPAFIRISSRSVDENDTFFVKKGNAANLFFSTNIKDSVHSKYVKWEITPATGPLQGMSNGYGHYTLSGIPEKAEKTDYTVTASYEVDGVAYLSDVYKFTLSVEENLEEQEKANDFYMVLRVTQGDTLLAAKTVWQGIHVTAYDGGGFGFQLYDAPIADPMAEESDNGFSFPEIDFGSGMTAAEIAKLRREQEKKVKELTATAKMTESEYNLMDREFNDGNIRATLDGEVVSLLTEEESRDNRQPIIKVSGGGGFFVEGSVSELEKDSLKPGQEVTINDWNTGMTYTGQVESIGDFPTQENGWNGMGNPTASYYPFRVFIDGSADLQEGSYVSVTYSAAEAENGIYLENPFLRTDDGETYVYVRGRNDRLEKRIVTTGKSLWGSYTEVRSGLTADDYIAFPYGKTVKPGAATQESDLSALYGY